MIDFLKTKETPLIIETGCSRQEDNFEGDGMSTLIFDEYVNQNGGTFCSVDINPKNIEFARSKISGNANLVCADSVGFLWNLNKELASANQYIDLLYLDSYDFQFENTHPSSFHHTKELLAIIPRLRPGSMIAIDDNFVDSRTGERIGKGDYVAQFFDNVGIKKIYDGYQYVWMFE